MAFFFKRAAEHKGTDMNKTTLGAPTPTPIKSKCVLIVDDDSFTQALFSEMLTSPEMLGAYTKPVPQSVLAEVLLVNSSPQCALVS